MTSLLFLVCTTAITMLSPALANRLKWQFQENAQESEFEMLKKIEIEKIKLGILEALGVEEPPTFSNSESQLSIDAIKMLIENSGEPISPVEQHTSLVNFMIFPTNREFQCQWSNHSSCRRFDFRISPDLVPSSTEFWVHKLETKFPENVTISVFRSLPNQKTEKIFEYEEFINESDKSKWLFFQFPALRDLKFWLGNEMYSVEIEGIIIDERLSNLPFLKITKDMEARDRMKRTENSTTNNTCVTIPFSISFAEMGYGHWIIHPRVYTANLCQGYCLKAKNSYESLMDAMFNTNNTLEERYGRCWATCCRPKEYDTLDMMYRETDEKYVQKTFTNMIVKSCSCQ